jgi:diguanylate cyclase (GGDEF)-like protein
MESTTVSATKRDPYSSLLLTLMPGAKGFGLFGAAGLQRWIESEKSMTGVGAELKKRLGEIVNQSVSQHKALMSVMADGQVSYAFPLGDGAKLHLGTLVVLVESTSGREPRSLPMVSQLLRPAMHCISRDMLLQTALGKARGDLRKQTVELDFLRNLESTFERKMGVTAGIETALDKMLSILGSGSITLSMPGYRIHCLRETAGAGKILDSAVLRRMEKNLLAWVSMHRRSVCMSEDGAEEASLDIDPQIPLLACPMTAADGGVEGVLMAIGQPRLVLEDNQKTLESLARKLSALIEARIDTATRALCQPAFEGELAKLSAAGIEHSLIFMSLERLARVRSEFGRQASDDVLGHFCSLVLSRSEDGQLFGRLGESNFSLLLPGVSPDEALKKARQICNAVTSLHYLNGEQGVSMSVSVGVAHSADASSASISVQAAAESACRVATIHGGNQVELYKDDEGSSVRPQGEIFLANYLGTALEEERFKLVAQAVYGSDDRQPCGYFEVFLRLIDEAGVEMPPGCFLPVAGRYDMLAAIDRWVVTSVTNQLGEIGSQNIPPNLVAGINLSGESIADKEFPGFVEEQLRTSDVPAQALCFEISESSLMADPKRGLRFIQALRDLGCKVALDNFGTGLSCLPFLENMPVDYVKIDGERVMAMTTSRISHSMVAAVNQAAKVMQLTAIAECVDTDEADSLIRAMGVDLVQGYTLSHPESLESFLQSIAGTSHAMSSGVHSA